MSKKFIPKTKIGKIAVSLALIGLVMLFIPYWIAMIFDFSIPIFSGFLTVAMICTSGVLSIVSIVKYHERAISIYISLIIGLFGFVLIIGEFVFPH